MPKLDSCYRVISPNKMLSMCEPTSCLRLIIQVVQIIPLATIDNPSPHDYVLKEAIMRVKTDLTIQLKVNICNG